MKKMIIGTVAEHGCAGWFVIVIIIIIIIIIIYSAAGPGRQEPPGHRAARRAAHPHGKGAISNKMIIMNNNDYNYY